MNIVDVIIIVLALVFCVKGYLHGFVNELFSLGIIVTGLAASFLFYKPLGVVVNSMVENRDLSFIIAFAGIFIFITLILVVARNTILRIVDDLNFTDADSLLGTFVGLFKGVLLCGIVFIFLKNHSFWNIGKAVRQSLIFPYLERTVTAVLVLLPEPVPSFIDRVLGA